MGIGYHPPPGEIVGPGGNYEAEDEGIERKGGGMLYESNMTLGSKIPPGEWVVMCDRCWGIITHLEKGDKESVWYSKEKENVCLYCRKKEREVRIGISLAP